ncbi:hypothetical protein Hypma_005003 [Hypsizygus marmoreus]|uniref:Uncharacterized protein n=1 Tax=Hypsizygus marmoreus TaxID=39966 RepID=A0A369K0U5_HYPMA|nr:hypothetical protein Hypma_005003 [Hypsizygus marmoreus]
MSAKTLQPRLLTPVTLQHLRRPYVFSECPLGPIFDQLILTHISSLRLFKLGYRNSITREELSPPAAITAFVGPERFIDCVTGRRPKLFMRSHADFRPLKITFYQCWKPYRGPGKSRTTPVALGNMRHREQLPCIDMTGSRSYDFWR